MKTTIDLPESLLSDTKALAEERGWMVKTVFEESLRAFLRQADQQRSRKPFRLRHTIVHGTALPEMSFPEMLEASGIDRLSK